MTGVLAALGAAMAWTGASALWRSLSGRVTAIRLNAMKNGLASLLFLPVLLTLPHNTEVHAVLLLLISGLIGIAAGDSFYLEALRRLGTRRTLTVEASGPVLASIAGVLVMGDSLAGEERSRRTFGFKRCGSHCHAGERDEPRGAGGQRC